MTKAFLSMVGTKSTVPRTILPLLCLDDGDSDLDQKAFHCVGTGLSHREKLVTLEGCKLGQHVDAVV